jgi:hypothetical protein
LLVVIVSFLRPLQRNFCPLVAIQILLNSVHVTSLSNQIQPLIIDSHIVSSLVAVNYQS